MLVHAFLGIHFWSHFLSHGHYTAIMSDLLLRGWPHKKGETTGKVSNLRPVWKSFDFEARLKHKILV